MNSRIARCAARSFIAAVITAMGFGAVTVACYASTAAPAAASHMPVQAPPNPYPWD